MKSDNTIEQLQKIQTVCLFTLATIAVCVGLYLLKPVLIPFVLAIFFTYCLTPIIDVQVKWLKYPRFLAVISTMILGFFILVLSGYFVTVSVNRIAKNSDDYRMRTQQFFDKTMEWAPLDSVGIDKTEWKTALFSNSDQMIGNVLSGAVNSVLGIVSNGALVLIFMIYILMGQKNKRPPASTSILLQIEGKVKKYLITMVGLSTITGLLVGASLHFLGVEFAFMFGFLTFLLNFIPSIGSIIATLLPVPVILANPDLSITVQILAFILPAMIQFVIGNLIGPKIMGDSLQLHPITVLLALIFFGIIWGVFGMLLATPIIAVVKICLEKTSFTRGYAKLLEGNLEDL